MAITLDGLRQTPTTLMAISNPPIPVPKPLRHTFEEGLIGDYSVVPFLDIAPGFHDELKPLALTILVEADKLVVYGDSIIDFAFVE